MDYIVKAYKDWKLHSQFHEIVPDMDDDYMFTNEKQSIRESARSLKKYGSTCCNHMRNNETLIRHEIEKTDTLQGIALKYGCTTEQIRRANRLFASDSLFLRQFLLVPVDKSSPYCLNRIETTDSNPISTPDIVSTAEVNLAANTTTEAANNPRPNVLPTRPYSIAGEMVVPAHDTDITMLGNHHNSGNSSGGNNNSNSCSSSSSTKQSKSLDSVVTMTPEEENRKCINDFLSKIDSTILESRKYVEKSKVMMTSQSDDDLFVTTDIVQRRQNNNLNNSYRNNRSNQHNHIRNSSTSSSSDTAQLLNTTQTRQVQNSLKRLEKQQDEFFQL